MKIKKNLLIFFAALSATSLSAQVTGMDGYIKGTGVEIGINGHGGHEGAVISASPLPAGMHLRSPGIDLFGFVANPQNNAWATYDGDYYTPGSPENGWGFEIDTNGVSKSNNSNLSVQEIPGSIAGWSHIGTTYSLDWMGSSTTGTDLDFLINYELEETDLFYTTTVTITNNTSSTIPDLYYYRNVDPDNNQSLSGDFMTQLTVLSQPVSSLTIASVTATQTLPWNSYFSFIGNDSAFRVGYGGFSNRDASSMWHGNAPGGVTSGYKDSVGATNLWDAAMFIAYRIQNFAPFTSRTFRFCSVFDTASVDCAVHELATSFALTSPVNTSTPAFTLTGGSPAGGTYSGPGIVGSNIFDPSVSGAGTFNIIYTHTDSSGCTATASASIQVDLASAITENDLSELIYVYPNPFSTSATIKISQDIKLSNAEFHLYDILGKEVYTLKNINSNEFRIEQKDLPAGVYFYKLMNNGIALKTDKLTIK